LRQADFGEASHVSVVLNERAHVAFHAFRWCGHPESVDQDVNESFNVGIAHCIIKRTKSDVFASPMNEEI
jgi:hypothetical protein